MAKMIRASIIFITFILAVSAHPATLNALSYYEKLDYDPSTLLSQHARVIREATWSGSGKGVVSLHLQAFNRSFVSRLSRGHGVFGPSVQFKVNGKETTEYDPRSFYSGHLEDEPGKSRVQGHIIEGVFDGTIYSEQHGTFHVERAHKFFPDHAHFHSIIYQERDVAVPDHTPSSCAAKGKLLKELNAKAAHAVPLKEEGVVYGEDRHLRLKRATINGNRFCPMRVAADHLYFQNVGNSNVFNTMSEMVSMFTGVQRIFWDADFDGNGVSDNIQPVIVSLEVLQLDTPGYRFAAEDIPVNDFLDLWSQEDQREFCLSLLLTHRDFDDGVLGLAWVAQPIGGNVGGICQGPVRLRTGIRFLNTGIVSTLNFGVTQPRAIVTITSAHELGHNFGSEHDPLNNSPCSPGGSQGNYLMFPKATDGSLPNNDRFSSCSMDFIRPVLETKSQCFTATAAFCGNGIREEDEECDCGNMCDQDNCCNGNTCTLTQGSVCSSTEPCCDETCQYSSAGEECWPATECGLAATCSGSSSTCPAPVPRQDSVLCNNGNNVCMDGICSGTVCVRMNQTDCQCSVGSDGDRSKLCHVCCMPKDGGGTCTSSFTLFGESMGQFKVGGKSCDNFDGFCSDDTPPRCVPVDNDQTLNELEEMLPNIPPTAGTTPTSSSGPTLIIITALMTTPTSSSGPVEKTLILLTAVMLFLSQLVLS